MDYPGLSSSAQVRFPISQPRSDLTFYTLLVTSLWLLLDSFSLSFSAGAQNHTGGQVRIQKMAVRRNWKNIRFLLRDFHVLLTNLQIGCSARTTHLHSLGLQGSSKARSWNHLEATHFQLRLLARTFLHGFSMWCLCFLKAWWVGHKNKFPKRTKQKLYRLLRRCIVSPIAFLPVTVTPRFKRRKYRTHFPIRGKSASHSKSLRDWVPHRKSHLGKCNLWQAVINTYDEFINTELVN